MKEAHILVRKKIFFL